MDQQTAPHPPISVLVADDQPLVRDLILSLLAREADMAAEGAEDLQEVLARIAEHGPFDVILLDFFMPGVEDLQGVARTIAANGGKPVLLMSGNLPAEMVEEARRLGVRGFLPKTRFGEIAEAVRQAATSGAAAKPAPRLSDAEQALLRDLAEGHPTEALKGRFGSGDLEAQLCVLFEKLGVRNRAQAILAAKRNGLV